jgi:hypothetical protein
MSSSKADPRREEAIVPFHLPRKSEDEEDYSSMLATLVCMEIKVRHFYNDHSINNLIFFV